MDLYENTLIGSFLYGLGAEVCAQNEGNTLAASVDLLQQTPLDSSLADVLVAAPRFFRLLEFKRVQNVSSKEERKQDSLRELLTRHPNGQTLMQTSIAIHHHVEIGYAGALPEGSPVLTVSPYVGGQGRTTSLLNLCRGTAQAMCRPTTTPTPAQCAAYLRLLTRTQGPLKRGSGGGATLLVAARDGLLEQAHVPDLRDFGLRGRELLARQQELDRLIEIQRQRERERERERLIEKAKQRSSSDRGYGIGD